MNILISSYILNLTGVPTFTLTMYKEMIKRGDKMIVYSPQGGKLENDMNVVRNLNGLKAPDVIIAQHIPCAEDLKKTFPQTPIIFYSHGLLPEMEQPPQFLADLYFVTNEEVEKNLIEKKVPPDRIKVVRDFIDADQFKCIKPVNNTLKNVIFISNYKKWKNFKAISRACQKLGLNLKCYGSPYGRHHQIEQAINEADLVVSWGRGILEGMACERPVLSFDRFEGDGYINQTTYFEARKDNFSGRVFHYGFTADTLAAEMQKYDPEDGEKNRQLVLKYHDAVSGVNQIYEHLKAFTYDKQ